MTAMKSIGPANSRHEIAHLACTLALLVAPLNLPSAHAQDITIEGIVRSASMYSAIQTFCTEFYAINPEAVRRYQQLYLNVGTKSVGRDELQALLEREMERRNTEVEVTGRSQWCSYQRANQEKLGVSDVFVETQKPAKVTASAQCTVADPTGTPLNVRRRPNGPILGALHNATVVIASETVRDAQGREWAKIVPPQAGRLGWVLRKFLSCA
jgi:hypothetical protein